MKLILDARLIEQELVGNRCFKSFPKIDQFLVISIEHWVELANGKTFKSNQSLGYIKNSIKCDMYVHFWYFIWKTNNVQCLNAFGYFWHAFIALWQSFCQKLWRWMNQFNIYLIQINFCMTDHFIDKTGNCWNVLTLLDIAFDQFD